MTDKTTTMMIDVGEDDGTMKGAFAAMKLTVCMDGFREISRCQNGVNSFVFFFHLFNEDWGYNNTKLELS